jgi:hypothetical protein
MTERVIMMWRRSLMLLMLVSGCATTGATTQRCPEGTALMAHRDGWVQTQRCAEPAKKKVEIGGAVFPVGFLP